MSGIFPEHLIDEPDDIERVIEDGEELRHSDGGSDDEDKKKEQEEKEKEKPKTRKATGPRPVLNAQRLMGPRGLATMESFVSNVKLKGRRGSEEKDLELIMKRLELWNHRLYPRGHFIDCLNKIEKLGNKKPVRNCVTRIRLGMEDESGQSDIIREELNSPTPSTSHEDPFDQLISSPTGPSVTTNESKTEMTTEQRERMLRNRLIAEEKRAARIKKAQELKQKFKAQQASDSQSVNEGVSSIETQGSIKCDRLLESSDRALQMEVDDNPDSTSVNNSIDLRVNGDRGLAGTDKELNTNDIQNDENKTNEESKSLRNLGNKPVINGSRRGQESSAFDVEEMLTDCADPKVSKSLENCEHSTNENIFVSNGVKQNENDCIEEMETCEMNGCMESLRIKNHIISKEEVKLKDEDVECRPNCKLKEKETHMLIDQQINGHQTDCFEKENENPNLI